MLEQVPSTGHTSGWRPFRLANDNDVRTGKRLQFAQYGLARLSREGERLRLKSSRKRYYLAQIAPKMATLALLPVRASVILYDRTRHHIACPRLIKEDIVVVECDHVRELLRKRQFESNFQGLSG